MLKHHSQGVLLSVHTQPGASREGFGGRHGDALKIRIRARPVEGAANAALREFLAAQFCLPLSRVTLVKGDKSRTKVFLLEIPLAEAERILASAIGTGE